MKGAYFYNRPDGKWEYRHMNPTVLVFSSFTAAFEYWMNQTRSKYA